jgi:hypothetical protein
MKGVSSLHPMRRIAGRPRLATGIESADTRCVPP